MQVLPSALGVVQVARALHVVMVLSGGRGRFAQAGPEEMGH